MATIHAVLAKVQSVGVAKIFYAHPAIQKTSLILNNKSVIKSEKGKIVKLSIKMMPSGKRILIGCVEKNYSSIQAFINEVTEESMVRASLREATSGYKPVNKFDGEQDSAYLVNRYTLKRFDEDEQTEKVEEEQESSDGFVHFGELYIPEIITRALSSAKQVASIMKAANVLLVGPSGNGKTSLAYEFANQYGLDFVKVNCSTIRDPEEWFGYREAVDGSTVFVETDFTKLVRKGNAVILLDEINRLEPYLHNSLMPLLDETRKTKVHGVDIEVGENVIFFCTMNVGTGFVGTFVLDNAIKNRMDMTIMMQGLSFDREVQMVMERTSVSREMAANIVKQLDRIREAASKNEIDIDVSHRSSLKIARLVGTGSMSVKEALTFCIFNNAESVDQAKMLVDSLIGGS